MEFNKWFGGGNRFGRDMARANSVKFVGRGGWKVTPRYKHVGNSALRRYAHRIPRPELKAFDSSYQNTGFLTAGSTATINLPVAGTELYNRVGRHTYNKTLLFRGIINNTATAVQDTARIVIYYDRQPNGASAPLAAVLQDSNPASATSAYSNINLTNRDRFTILADIQLDLPAVVNTGGVLTNGPVMQDPIRQTFNIKQFIKLKNVDTTYNTANAGNVGDITTGAINILFVSNSNSNQWACGWTTRLRYYD